MSAAVPPDAKWKFWLLWIDEKVAAGERTAAGVCCASICVLLIINVLVRGLRIPVFWIDEIAVYLMIWMVFLAAAAAVRTAEHMSVDILEKSGGWRWQRLARRLSGIILLVLGLACCAFAWIWFDPVSFVQAGGDVELFTIRTLNFIYMEPVSSFEAPKVLFWLIMPYFSISLTFHAAVRLLDSSGDIPSEHSSGKKGGV